MTNVADTDATAISEKQNSGAYRRVSKAEWAALGGDSNPQCDWAEGAGYIVYDELAFEQFREARDRAIAKAEETPMTNVTETTPAPIRFYQLGSHPLAQKFYDLSIELEKLPGNPRQTDLIISLGKLKQATEDFINGVEPAALPPSRDDAQAGVVRDGLPARARSAGRKLHALMGFGVFPKSSATHTTLARAYDAINEAADALEIALSAALPPSRDDAVGVDMVGLRDHLIKFAEKVGPLYVEDIRDCFASLPSFHEPAQQPIDRATVIEECAKVAKSWEATSRKLADAANGFEKKLHHELAADMAGDIASSIRALTDKEPTNG